MNRLILVAVFILATQFSFAITQTDSITSLQQFFIEKNISKPKIASKGLFYNVQKAGTTRAQVGNYVVVHYTGKLLTGKVFDSSHNIGEPFVFKLGENLVIEGWEIGIPLFGKGGKGTLYVPSDLAYGARGAGRAIPPNSPLIFEIEVVDVLTEEGYDDYIRDLEAREKAAFDKEIAIQFEKDKKIMKDIAKKRKLQVKTTDSGLQYVIYKTGKGKKITGKNDKIKLKYTGYLADGKEFGSTDTEGKLFPFTTGGREVIKGLEEAVSMLREGGVATLIVPSKLAYGPMPIEGFIPPNAVLVFEIEVKEVK